MGPQPTTCKRQKDDNRPEVEGLEAKFRLNMSKLYYLNNVAVKHLVVKQLYLSNKLLSDELLASKYLSDKFLPSKYLFVDGHNSVPKKCFAERSCLAFRRRKM